MFEVSLPIFIAIWSAVGLVVITTIVLIVRATKRRMSKSSDVYSYVASHKATIDRLVAGTTETEYRMALIEADKLLDYVLKLQRFAGTTLGERLKVACYKHPELRAIWPAHLMRNRAVHEHNVVITNRQIKKLWKQYQDAYKVLYY